MWLNCYNRVIMMNSENTFVKASLHFFLHASWKKYKLINMENCYVLVFDFWMKVNIGEFAVGKPRLRFYKILK